MKELVEKLISPVKLIFRALDILDLLALLVLTVIVLVAVPYGIIKLFIDRDQILLATLFSICLLISIVALIIHFRNKRKTRD